MSYTTQMNAARQGIITDEMRTVAEKEGIAPEKLMEYVAAGTAIIPCNKNQCQSRHFEGLQGP